MRRSAWGKGYATEGAATLIRWGFSAWGVQRVTATTYQENLASRRVLEQLGFALVRRFLPTPQDLAAHTTNAVTGEAVWEGDDCVYLLERETWLRREGLVG